MSDIRIPYGQSRGRGFVSLILHGGVHENPIFYGNQVQIKVAEKEALYRYFLLHGHLPPGNKIFR